MKEMGNHYCATTFAGIFSLIQAIVWCFSAIYFVAVYACKIDFPTEFQYFGNTVAELFYISYFFGKCRTMPFQAEIEAPSAARTYNWLLAYGIISAIWIPTSVTLLIQAIAKFQGRYGFWIIIPWILNSAALLIMDFCTSIIYGLDISHTLTVKDYEMFVQPLIIYLPNSDSGLTVLPAIFMTIFFSRAIVIWLINLVLFIVVIQHALSIRRKSPTMAFVENEARAKTPNDGSSSQWVNIRTDDMKLKRLPRLQLEDSPITSRSSILPISPQSPITETPPPSIQSASMTPTSTPPIPTVRKESLKWPDSSPVYDVTGKHLGNVLPEEIINKHIPTNKAARKSGLSNQVPWTYAPPGELNFRIKQTAMHNRDNNKQPQLQIPDPDYTMHFPSEKKVPIITFSTSKLNRSDSNLTTSDTSGSDHSYQTFHLQH